MELNTWYADSCAGLSMQAYADFSDESDKIRQLGIAFLTLATPCVIHTGWTAYRLTSNFVSRHIKLDGLKWPTIQKTHEASSLLLEV